MEFEIDLKVDCSLVTLTGPSSFSFEISPPPTSDLSKTTDVALNWSVDESYFTSDDLWYWQGQTKDFELLIYEMPVEYDFSCALTIEISDTSGSPVGLPDFMTFDVDSSVDYMYIKMAAQIN